MRRTAHIGLGTNLGDREANLRFAARALATLDGARATRASNIYETDAVGPGGQGAYLNAVIELETRLAPRALLEALLAIEVEAGRTRAAEVERWSPRILDLDLLLYGCVDCDEPGLCIPHPRLHERAFVLEPLRDLVPDHVHPHEGVTIAELARKQRDPEAVRRWPASLEVDA